ncbi:MAG: TIGR00645 family protein [Planctomycetes bacterium]|nr:TIGR00645 family protein [Planctomycetota bacterium]
MVKLVESGLERMIFMSRWLQAPLYVGLIIAQVAYTWKFGVELWHVVSHTNTLDGKHFLSGVLELIDFVMVANLIIMVVIGGYATFVSKLDLDDHDDRPDWLEHIDPGSIKVKLAGSLIGISSIHLLQAFIQLGSTDANGQPITSTDLQLTQIGWQIVLHLVFLISTVMLALTEMIMHRRYRPDEGPHAAKTSLPAGQAH